MEKNPRDLSDEDEMRQNVSLHNAGMIVLGMLGGAFVGAGGKAVWDRLNGQRDKLTQNHSVELTADEQAESPSDNS